VEHRFRLSGGFVIQDEYGVFHKSAVQRNRLVPIIAGPQRGARRVARDGAGPVVSPWRCLCLLGLRRLPSQDGKPESARYL
jgi:hypothetical protein